MGFSHVFSEIFLHVNWHCHNDKPMITQQMEPILFSIITEYCKKTKGVHFVALNGTPTHVHLAFQMEPFVALSDFIGHVKGASSHEINKKLQPGSLQWQRGYGAVSFAKSQSRYIIEYIRNQKEHHGVGGQLNDKLEIHDYSDESNAGDM